MRLIKFPTLTLGLILAATSTGLVAKSPYDRKDGTWISLEGEVRSVSADTFSLDYGDGYINVEFDDGDRDADAYKLKKGDRVSVSGIIDDDFYESASIEASSVYVENLDTYFFASAVDEEDSFVTVSMPLVVSDIVIQGKVNKIDDTEFTLDTGARELTVEVDSMLNNPLDQKGYQQLSKGDIVSVRGTVDERLFDDRTVEAQSVITLFDKENNA